MQHGYHCLTTTKITGMIVAQVIFCRKIFELFGAEELWSSMTEEEREDLLQDSLYD